MANYVVKVSVTSGGFPNLFAGSGTDGNTSSSPLELAAGDTVTFQRQSIASGKSITISGLSIFTANNDVTMSAFSGSPVTRTVATGSTTSNGVLGTCDQTNEIDSYFFKRVAASSVTAPTASSVTFNNPASSTVTATVNLSAQGSGGTLQYALDIDNSSPTNWQSSNQFAVARAASGTVYARARRDAASVSNTVNATRPGFLLPDDSVSAPDVSITASATSASTTVSNGTSGESVLCRLNGDANNTNLGTTSFNSSGQATLTLLYKLPSAGSTNTYTIFTKRPTLTGGDGSTYHSTGDTFDVTRASASPTYSLTAPTSVNEGSAATISVATTNVSNSTTLYWAVQPSGDFGTSTGSVSISGNSASFTLTPTSDSETEGAETATVVLYTDSARTNNVASDSFTINDTSTGGSGGSTGGGSGGSSNYGIEINSVASSPAAVFGVNFRTSNIQKFSNSTITGNGGTVSFTNIGSDATDSSKVVVVVDAGWHSSSGTFPVSRSTANGGTVTVTNNRTSDATVKIIIVRVA